MIFSLVFKLQTPQLPTMSGSRWRPRQAVAETCRRQTGRCGQCGGRRLVHFSRSSMTACFSCPDHLILQTLWGNMLLCSCEMYSFMESERKAAKALFPHNQLMDTQKRDWPGFHIAFPNSSYFFLILTVSLNFKINVLSV